MSNAETIKLKFELIAAKAKLMKQNAWHSEIMAAASEISKLCSEIMQDARSLESGDR